MYIYIYIYIYIFAREVVRLDDFQALSSAAGVSMCTFVPVKQVN
jgi:hypothetical protein